MKHFLTLIAITLALNAHSQSYDSLTKRILNLQVTQQQIQINLQKHQNQYSLGTSLLVAGIALTIADQVFGDDKEESKNLTFTYIGGTTATIGYIIQIDSHKWIGRSGRKRKH